MDDNGEHHVVRIDYKWVLAGPSGVPIAESPPVYRDAGVCRRAFADAQRAARTALGSHRNRS
jgi:hypothetical protein